MPFYFGALLFAFPILLSFDSTFECFKQEIGLKEIKKERVIKERVPNFEEKSNWCVLVIQTQYVQWPLCTDARNLVPFIGYHSIGCHSVDTLW